MVAKKISNFGSNRLFRDLNSKIGTFHPLFTAKGQTFAVILGDFVVIFARSADEPATIIIF